MKCGRILLMDSDRGSALVTRRELEALGHAVVAIATRPAKLAALLVEHAPDILVVNAACLGERVAMRLASQAQERAAVASVLRCSVAQRRGAQRARADMRDTNVLHASDAPSLGLLIQVALYRGLLEREQRRAVEQNTRATEAEAVIRTSVRLVHQLNNMLSAIRCNAFLIQMESQAKPDLLEAARDITTAVERGAELMTQVTALAREHSAEAGRLGAQIAELIRADERAGRKPNPRGRGARTKTPSQRSVLVVDDDHVVHRAVTRFLTNRGYRILAASSPREALSLAEQEPIDVLITDLIMPEMTGYDLSARIQKMRPEARVIYMSGYAAGTFASSVGPVQASSAPLLQKPFAVETLLQLLSTALGEGEAPAAPVAAGIVSASNDP
jgi:CheY-like chemotaxis protein